MIIPTIKLIYDRKHTATQKNEAPVEVRITYNRKPRYISTGVRLLPKHWRNGTVVNRFDAKEINDALETIVANVRKVINEMVDAKELNTAEIKARLDRMMGQAQTFIEFAEKRAEIRAYGKKADSQERYARFLRWLKAWGKVRFFSDITESAIMDMDRELDATGMKPYSKWNNYHRFMNSFILDAMDEGLVRRNPYRWLHIDKQKETGLHKYLTPDEMKMVEQAEMPTESLERVRDLFVFQVYTCLSYTDLADFDVAQVKEMESGAQMYTGKRGKTGQEFTFVLLDKAKAVLDKYGGSLPIISNVKYNAYLKVVAQSARVDKPITSHWARHTGATLLLNAGVNIEVVAKILGHATTKQTRETYAKLLDETVAKEMQKIG